MNPILTKPAAFAGRQVRPTTSSQFKFGFSILIIKSEDVELGKSIPTVCCRFKERLFSGDLGLSFTQSVLLIGGMSSPRRPLALLFLLWFSLEPQDSGTDPSKVSNADRSAESA